MVRIVATLALLAGCQDIKEIGGGAGLDLTWIPGVGQVFKCDLTDGSSLELCFDGEADELEDSLFANEFGVADCSATPRHLGPCLACCSDDCGRGANAFNGTWCGQ